GSGERHMAGADVTAGQHKVSNVFRVERPQRDVVGLGIFCRPVRLDIPGIKTRGGVVIHGPAAEGYAVFELFPAAFDVGLDHDVLAGDAAGFALAGDHTDGIQGPVFRLGKVAAVFDI